MNETMRKTIIESMNDIINCIDDNCTDNFKLALYKYDVNNESVNDDIMKELLVSFIEAMQTTSIISVDNITISL